MAVLNGEFETDVSGWTAEGGGAISRQTTTFHAGAASALCTTSGTDNQGVYTTMTGDAAQNSTWDVVCFVKAHGAGDVGATVVLRLESGGGSFENFDSTPFALVQGGWTQLAVTGQFANASHSGANVGVKQSGAHAAFSFDLDTVSLARHLAYLPSGDPKVTGLWVPGVPAGNYSEPSDARTAQLIASALYAGA